MGVFAPNCIDTGPLTWGVHWATGVVSPANPAYSAAELAFQLKNSESKALLTQPAVLEIAFEAAKIAGIPRNRIIVMGDEKCGQAQHFSDFIQSAKDVPNAKRNVQAPSDLAYIPYSSGTTGLPKVRYEIPGSCTSQNRILLTARFLGSNVNAAKYGCQLSSDGHNTE